MAARNNGAFCLQRVSPAGGRFREVKTVALKFSVFRFESSHPRCLLDLCGVRCRDDSICVAFPEIKSAPAGRSAA